MGERTKRLPANIKDFITQEIGRKPDEIIEISEISDALNAFERKNKLLIPDRDVLETQPLTARQLVEALNQRLNKDPSGIKPTPSLPLAAGGKTLSNARPFQRQALLNNPNHLMGNSRQGLTDGQNRYYDTGSLEGPEQPNLNHPSRPNRLRPKDIMARAILSVRPELGDPRSGSDFSRYLLGTEPISDTVYAELQKTFQQNPTKEEWEALDLAIQRIELTQTREAYSNGQSVFDSQGREVYPNGKPKFDSNGRPIYPNGRRMFDDDGNELHSNGRRKFNSNGIKLYANGYTKTSRTGVDLFPDGAKMKNNRGVSLYDNGRPKVNVERSVQAREGVETLDPVTGQVTNPEAAPLDPRGRPQVREEDGVVLYDNGQAKTNNRGIELYRNGQSKVSSNGVELYDNGKKSENNQSRALTYDSKPSVPKQVFKVGPTALTPSFALRVFRSNGSLTVSSSSSPMEPARQ